MAQTKQRVTTEYVVASTPPRHFNIVIVGGGSAGISVAARLANAIGGENLAIIEPSNKHYYQPLWTLVGGGLASKEESAHDEADVIPRGATWIKEAAIEFRPDQNVVVLASDELIGYNYLVIATGLQLNWSGVAGLEGNIGKHGIVSNYDYAYCDKTFEALRNFKGGTALFTMPATPIKCGGAPQKIAYLADDYWRRTAVRDKAKMIYLSATPAIFQVKEYAASLAQVAQRKGIETRFKHNLTAIRPERHEAVFLNMDTNEEVVLHYDLIHITPPMSAPDVVRNSPLANQEGLTKGWVATDKHSLRHRSYPNVFAIGDVTDLPTSKTGAAIRKQAPILVKNLLSVMRGGQPQARYDGYTSCPLVTAKGKLILAEFDYDLKPQPSFPFLDSTKEHWLFYQLKRRGLPLLYWQGMLRGRM
jgi:sulfide:quinone oxidoreductase